MDRAALIQKFKDKKGMIALVISTAVLAGTAGVVVPKLLAPKQGDAHAVAVVHETSHKTGHDTGHDAGPDAHQDSHQAQDTHKKSKAHKEVAHTEHKEKSQKKEVHAKIQPPSLSVRIFESIKEGWSETQKKLTKMRFAMEENERLKIENAALQIKAESLKFDCTYKASAHKTHDAENKLVKETGSKVGRSLSSITYTPPTHLLPTQLYVLGVSYFKAKEDEKAAVILTFLTGLEESDTFKNAKNYLMAGVAWYRLDNFAVADEYFAKAISTKEVSENLPYQAQARLWRGLVAQNLSQRSKAQFWLRDLIDHHPHSAEAGWVNPNKETRRVPASVSQHH